MKKRASTKEKLLNILKKDHKCTIKDIMDHFTISEIAVRRHLHELEKQGFIKKEEVKQDIGRPYHMYLLTEKGHQTFPNQYEQLPLELLQDLEVVQGKQVVSEVLAQRMEREKALFKERIQTDDFDKQIVEMLKIQDEQGYMNEYKKTPEGDYEITNYNCPILNIASSYTEICSNEKKVLSDVFTDSEVISKTCITRGDIYCKWVITKPKTNNTIH